MRSLYEQLGEDNLRRLVEAFYDIIEREPAAEELHLLHLRGHGVAHSRIEQFNFLSGFFGGPKLYVEKFGHANLKRIHEHIEITSSLRELWLCSMSKAIDEINLPRKTAEQVMRYLTNAANTIGQDARRPSPRDHSKAVVS